VLIKALSLSGGSGLDGARRILIRTAVTAILNARKSVLVYPLTEAQIVAAVNALFPGGSKSDVLALAKQLEDYNFAGCLDKSSIPLPCTKEECKYDDKGRCTSSRIISSSSYSKCEYKKGDKDDKKRVVPVLRKAQHDKKMWGLRKKRAEEKAKAAANA